MQFKSYLKILFILPLFILFIAGGFVLTASPFVRYAFFQKKELTIVDEYIKLIKEGKPDQEIVSYLEKFSDDQVMEAIIRFTYLDPNDKKVQQAGQDLFKKAFPQDGESSGEEILVYIARLPRDQALEALVRISTPDDEEARQDAQEFFQEAFREAEKQYSKSFHQLSLEQMTKIADYICQVSKSVPTANAFCSFSYPRVRDTEELLFSPAVQRVMRQFDVMADEIIAVQRIAPYSNGIPIDTIDVVITSQKNYFFWPASGVVQDTPPASLSSGYSWLE